MSWLHATRLLPFRRLHTHRLYTVLPLLFSLITLTGCATHKIRLQPVRAAFQRGDVVEADVVEVTRSHERVRRAVVRVERAADVVQQCR